MVGIGGKEQVPFSRPSRLSAESLDTEPFGQIVAQGLVGGDIECEKGMTPPGYCRWDADRINPSRRVSTRWCSSRSGMNCVTL